MEIPVGHCQVNLRWEGAALPTGAEVTFALDTGLFAPDPSTIPDVVEAAYMASNWRALMTNQTALTSIKAKMGPTATGPTFEKSLAIQGTDAGQGVPANTSLLVTKVTAFGGRAGRGRFYIPAFDETEVDAAGNLSPAMRTAAQNAMNTFLTELEGDNLSMEVLHGDGSPLSEPSNVTSLVVQNKVATQRRRLRR